MHLGLNAAPDEHGTASTTVATALANLNIVSAQGLEQRLVVAGRHHGRHGFLAVSAIMICSLRTVDCLSAMEMPHQRSARVKTFVLSKTQISSEKIAGLEIKSGDVLIETIVKTQVLADNGIWNWPMDAATAATIRIC